MMGVHQTAANCHDHHTDWSWYPCGDAAQA